MTSIRTRTVLLITLSLSLLGVFSFLTYSAFINYTELSHRKEQSYSIVDAAFAHQKNKLSEEKINFWQAQLPSIQPEFRSRAFEAVLKNPNNDNIQFLLKTENEFRPHVAKIIEYFSKRILYFGAIMILSAVLLCLGISHFVFRQIFNPLADLSKKMVDFLNNKYSYKFGVPETNEIGELHATFNSMAQKVLTQIEDLKALDKAKSEFLSIASHELRTPLTSIKGSLSLLNSGVIGKMNENTTSLLSIALNETDRLIRIINELLDLAKIEARQFPLTQNWVWADHLIQTTFAGLDGFAKTAEVKLAAADSSGVDLWIDQDRLQQVLTNLLSNAIKFSPKGGTVSVAFVETAERHMRVEVSDQGRGIAPEDQELIFEKFRQATSSQNPLVKGTGLGLAIAKALVEQHGGLLGVRSVPGQGSTFYFTLPEWRPHQNVATSYSSSGAA